MTHQHSKYKNIWQCRPNCQPCINPAHGTVYHWACRVQGCQWKSRIFAVKA
jgi:hypothetical protein